MSELPADVIDYEAGTITIPLENYRRIEAAIERIKAAQADRAALDAAQLEDNPPRLTVIDGER